MSGECEKCGEHTLDCGCHNHCGYCVCRKYEWINIKDGLPHDYFYVLVFGSDTPGFISIARQYEGKWEMLSYSDESNAVSKGDLTWFMTGDEITHWMPLPTPPHITLQDNNTFEKVGRCHINKTYTGPEAKNCTIENSCD